MPENRPGQVYYATATKAIDHGLPCIEDGVPGVAFKTVAPKWSDGYGGSPDKQKNIAIGEKFTILIGGIVKVPKGALTLVKGTQVYITLADNTLSTASGAGKVPYGVVVEAPLERGLPSTHARVNLNLRDTKSSGGTF